MVTTDLSKLSERVRSSIMLETIKKSGRPLVVSFSGGKDSTAMCIYLLANNVKETNPIYWIFADTGWEHPSVYEYVEYINKTLLDEKLHKVSNPRFPNGMEDLVKYRKRFPASNARFCTNDLKLEPIRDFLRSIKAKYDLKDEPLKPVNVVGIRAEESHARSQLLEWESGTNLEKSEKRRKSWDTWRPGIGWLLSDVISLHTAQAIAPCDLYLKDRNFVSRVGCFPCIFARKNEIKGLAEEWPERIVQIRKLEEDVNKIRKARCDEEGGEIHEKNYKPVSFFTSKDYRRTNDPTMPIDKVVEWSRTTSGGKQFELFEQDENERGCGMWGLCERV